MKEKTEKGLFAVGVAVVVLFTALLWWLVGEPMLRFVEQPEQFRAWVDAHGIGSRIAFVGMVVFQVIVAVIPGEPLEIGAGYAFGAMEGTLLCLIGVTIGGAAVFGLVRTFGMRLVRIFFSEEKIHAVPFFQNTRRVKTVAFVLFFLPGTPKDLLSYVAGLTELRWPYWLFLTSVARLPSIVTSTVGGDALGGANYGVAVAVFAITLLLSGVGLWIYNRYEKKKDDR